MDNKELESKLSDWFDKNEIDWFSGVGGLIRSKLKQLHRWKETSRGKPERGSKLAWLKSELNEKEFNSFKQKFDLIIDKKSNERDNLLDSMIKEVKDRI